MSGPHPPGVPGDQPGDGDREELTDTGFSRAYSAPESEHTATAWSAPTYSKLHLRSQFE